MLMYRLCLLVAGIAFFLGLVSAQTVRIENLSPVPFAGWKRTTIDRAPPHEVGQVGTVTYVVGRRIGLDARVVAVLAEWNLTPLERTVMAARASQ